MKKLPVLIMTMLMMLCTLKSPAQKAIERVEPPFWWTGMKHDKLQLMIYGEQIAQYTPEIDYPGVTLDNYTLTANRNYLFVNLTITNQAKPGRFNIEFRRDGKIAHTHNYELKARKQGSASREGFNSSDVIYLVTPDRFANGNPDNDEVPGMKEGRNRKHPGGRHGGDIQGLQQHLDYIADMGFTALWLNPLLENNMAQYSYHGYSTTDYYRIDPRYGSNQSYKAMVQQAREKGIKVIMDQIVNHIGAAHWWMKDLPAPDWVHYPDSLVITNHERTTHQDPHASEYDKQQMVNGWFVESMPDLNQNNPLLAEYLIQNSIWWIEYAGLQGIRQDTYPYPDAGFLSRWSCRIMKEYPDFNIVGEEWSYNPAIVAYWQRGKSSPDGYKSCLPSVMDFPLHRGLIKALNAKMGGWEHLYRALSNDFQYANPQNLVIIPDNHDMSRFYTQINEDDAMYRTGLAFLLTTRGIPQIYYGTEILMANPNSDKHGVIRSDFPGGWPDDEVNAFTGKRLPGKKQRAQQYMKTLLNMRQENPVLHTGKLTHFIPFDGFYVYFRYNRESKIMVVLNKNNERKKLPLQRFEEMLHDVKTGRDLMTGEHMELQQFLMVPPKSPLILELK